MHEIELEILTITSLQLCKVQVNANATISDVKRAIEHAVPKYKFNRQSLRDHYMGIELSNHQLISTATLPEGNRLYLDDLGHQVSWSGSFIIEFIGPLLIYAIFGCRPLFIYGPYTEGMTTEAIIAWACWSMHYIRRILETLFVHRFTHDTMPISRLLKNCGFHWSCSTFVAYSVNHPQFMPPIMKQVWFGMVIFWFCEIGNMSVYYLLRNLRPPGTKIRKIPQPTGNPFTWLFNYVSCPHYTYEYGAWMGFAIMTNCVPAFLFATGRMFQMTAWALKKQQNYMMEFYEYPCDLNAIIPFVI